MPSMKMLQKMDMQRIREVKKEGEQDNEEEKESDSFHGMADPGSHDGEKYPKGRFSVGGPDAFRQLMQGKGLAADQYILHPGYVPTVLADCPGNLRLSLALVDLDHY